MKHLLILPFESNFIVPNRLFVTLENAELLVRKGEEVSLVYCDGNPVNMCWINTKCDKWMCRICNHYRKSMFAGLSSSIKLIPIHDFFHSSLKDYNHLSFQYNSNADIKKITYKNVKIGYAALSSYISPTRNMYPLFDEAFRQHFDATLKATAITTDIFLAALDHCQPDQVGIFNSRFTVSRPIYETCKHKGINVMVYETTGNVVNNRRLTYFYNNTPHGIAYNTELIYQMWASDMVPENQKIEMAERFFQNRRNAIPAGDRVYVKDQQQGLLPDGWDAKKHNIVILNSSEDEFASLDEEFEGNLYPSQYEGIKDIFERHKDNKEYHFYLRIHPNLKDIPYAYHKKLYELANISDNVTIIPGNSPISTYGLIDAAEKIIVFGSTAGQEAVYWGKPVILLARAAYSLLNICYIPESKEELDQMIQTLLTPKDKLPALQLAYYRINNEREPLSYFQYEIKHYQFLGKKFDIYKWKVRGRVWNKYFCIFLQFIGAVYRQQRYPRPTKENPNAIL